MDVVEVLLTPNINFRVYSVWGILSRNAIHINDKKPRFDKLFTVKVLIMTSLFKEHLQFIYSRHIRNFNSEK